MEFRGGERENDSWGKAPKVTSLAAQVTRCDEMHFSSSPSPPHFYEHFFFWGGWGDIMGYPRTDVAREKQTNPSCC